MMLIQRSCRFSDIYLNTNENRASKLIEKMPFEIIVKTMRLRYRQLDNKEHESPGVAHPQLVEIAAPADRPSI